MVCRGIFGPGNGALQSQCPVTKHMQGTANWCQDTLCPEAWCQVAQGLLQLLHSNSDPGGGAGELAASPAPSSWKKLTLYPRQPSGWVVAHLQGVL